MQKQSRHKLGYRKVKIDVFSEPDPNTYKALGLNLVSLSADGCLAGLMHFLLSNKKK
ncbi:MAG: hypothetical protein IPF54_11560 [Draconibacterium sp.]|nr:hypothetical protein [Draconibacterium sp.]